SALLDVEITNPATARTVLHYAVQDAKGVVLGEGEAPPAAAPLDVLRLLPGGGAGGDFFVVITGADGSVPDSGPMSGYAIQLGSKPELDANDTGTRNDSGATATCLAGAVDPRVGCPMAYAGGQQSFSGKGQIGGLGDRDFFRFDVAGGVPAVVEIASSIGDT